MIWQNTVLKDNSLIEMAVYVQTILTMTTLVIGYWGVTRMPQWLGIAGIYIRLLTRNDRFSYLRRFSTQVSVALGSVDKHSESLLLRQRLRNKQLQRCYVICRNNDIIGALHVMQRKDEIPLLYCWLHEHFWARGVFKRCIRIVCADVRKTWNTTAIAAHVSRNNIRSLYAFYKAGFTCIRTNKLQYHLITRLYQWK